MQIEDFTNEGVVASGSWPYQVNLLVADGAADRLHHPRGGGDGWADTTMLHANAPHPNCAYLWMEHSLDPKVQGDVAAWFGSVPAVRPPARATSCSTDEGCATNGFDNFDQDRVLEDARGRLLR